MGAFSWLSSLGRAFKAFPDYAAQSNMDYALYRALGPDWKNIYDQEKRERELGLEREEIQAKQDRTKLAADDAEAKLKIAKLVSWTDRPPGHGRYVPSKVGTVNTADIIPDYAIAGREMRKERKSKEAFRRALELQKAEPEPVSDAEKALAEARRASAYATREKLTSEYLQREAEAKEGARAKFGTEPSAKPKPVEIDKMQLKGAALVEARKLAPEVEERLREEDEERPTKWSDYTADVQAKAEERAKMGFRKRKSWMPDEQARQLLGGGAAPARSQAASVRQRVVENIEKGVPKSQWGEEELAYIEELRRKRALARQ